MQNAWKPTTSELEREPPNSIDSPEDRLAVGKAAVRLFSRIAEIQAAVIRKPARQKIALSRTECSIFFTIATGENRTQVELACACGIHQATVSRVVKMLVDGDWVKVLPPRPGGSKRSASRCVLTGKGKKLLATWYAEIGQHVIADGGHLSPHLERILKILVPPPRSRRRINRVSQVQLALDMGPDVS